ncbi:MAG: type IV secretory system conjugative DNA transfer family protein [Candidatus Levybacteria bacterium]|nr:type IV secretory system conjugative DNA transfer family protein [Candidatus Levybacteria bacterium]
MDGIISGVQNFISLLITATLWSFFAAIFLIVIKILLSKLLFQQKLTKTLKKKDEAVLFIKIPTTNEQKEDAMEAFLLSVHRILDKNSYLSLEMVSTEQFLRFFIVVGKVYQNAVESQLYAQFPDAEVEKTPDYIPEKPGPSSIVELGFKHSSTIPLTTYKNSGEDILKNLSAILSKTSSGETVVVQIALKKIGSKAWDRGIGQFFAKTEASLSKMSGDIFRGKLRLVYASTDKQTAQSKLSTIASLFKSVKGANELKKKISIFSTDLYSQFRARTFEKGDFWSIPEIATLFHFPYKGTVISNVVNTSSKKAPAPDTLPLEGSIDLKDVSFFGETNYRNDRKKFGIKRLDRRRHLYIVGKTGSGKSRLLQLLLVSDIQNGEGCCLIDPHGDLAEEVLKFVPKERATDVIYVNPTDRDFPIGFNPLEPVTNYEERQHLSRFFISIFKKMFAENWNSRMEHLLRYITLALLETPDSNVLGITRILSDTNYRQRVIKQIQDPVVKSFWTNEFSASNEQFISVAAVPIMNKMGQFISNPVIRNMVGQRKNMLDFEKFMNEGKIVIINLSKGKIGEDNAALLGSMFITKIQQAALARAKMTEEERRDFYFYIDEFQNFATDAFSSILSEARKYHLDLTIAHQYIAQLPEDVKATAFGNVGSIITFGVGGDDAAYLAKEYSPIFSPEDMINLNVREMYVKMSIDGKLTPPFSARTIDTPKSEIDYSNEIMDKSRVKYGRNRTQVENEVERWASGSSSTDPTSSEGGFPEPII